MLPLLPLLLPPTLPPLLVLALEGCCSCLLPSAPDRPQHWSQCLPKMLIRSALITETRKEANTERSRSEATRKHTTTSISTNHHGLCKTSVGHRTHTYKREKGNREREEETDTNLESERERIRQRVQRLASAGLKLQLCVDSSSEFTVSLSLSLSLSYAISPFLYCLHTRTHTLRCL